MKTIEELRAEFEEWVGTQGPEWSSERRMDGEYAVILTRGAWLAWQEKDRRTADDRETVRLIEELRAGNGRLGIFTDCRDAKSLVVVWAQGGDPELRFYSNNLLDCLHKAVAEKRKTLDGRQNQD